ncbi:MAG: bifunctional folylpolyglutamate synthase/dihydrofolate synthase, partial [Chloroflexi bacterium]|nr:bifunctional folylpolyglutamate synthase/dihydrofolate synthase [Chloroflexota bacterium]
MTAATFDAYRQAVAYVESFITGPAEAPGARDPAEQARLHARRLPRTAALLAALGDPHRRFGALHVAGTAGKGSTCTIMGSVLRAAGYRVGVYTSPYLQTAIEKVEVNGRPMSPHALVDLVADLRPVVEQAVREEAGPVAYAQLWAALAFTHFARQQVDWAVVEVGMGGRFDYTNVLTPAVVGISNVSFDHVTSLGPTLRDIAWHKAGIIKPEAAAVTGADQPEVLEVIAAECRQQGVRLTRSGPALTFRVRAVSSAGGVFDYRGERWACAGLRVGLLGEHQIANAALALGMLERLEEEQGVVIPEEAVRAGLAQARIPGRLEIVQEHPLVVLDGAHNPDKAHRLREALLRLFPGRRIVLVLGMLSAKEADGILRELVPLADLTVTTAPSVLFKPAVPPQELAERIAALGGHPLW